LKEDKMGFIKEILGEIIKIDFKPKADQMGIFNVKTTKNTFHGPLIFTTPEAARAFGEAIASGNQTKIVENAEKLLAANSTMLKVLSESTAMQVANATLVASTAAALGMEGKVKAEKFQVVETLNIGESVFVKLSPEPHKSD
jgi:hypothetical protein